MKTKQLALAATSFKATGDGMKFTCYGNVKGNVDHALDRTLDGAYQDSIDEHKSKGTMPKMFWMHNPYETPVGKWIDMKEDHKGLYLEGEFANTEKGRELYELMKMGALDSFSIGYRVVEEKWNSEKRCNDLIKLDIREVSVVSFACNEESRLQSIKSKIDDGELPTKRELQKVLQDSGLSKRQAERIVNQYDPELKEDALAGLAKHLTEQSVAINL